MKELPGLEPGEHLRATAHASFRGSAMSSMKSIWVPRTKARNVYDVSRTTLPSEIPAVGAAGHAQHFDAWETGARAAGFPTAGHDMVIGVTDTRLVVWRTSWFLNRPVELAGSIPLARIQQVATVRHGLVVGVAFVVDGSIVEIEAMRGRRLRQLAAAVEAVGAEQRHG